MDWTLWTASCHHSDVKLFWALQHGTEPVRFSNIFTLPLSQLCYSGTNHSGEFGFSTHCSSAEWFNRSELRHSPRANNFLRWCLSCASAILSACSGQKSEICFLKKDWNERTCRALDFSYVSGSWNYEAGDVFWKIIWAQSKSPEGSDGSQWVCKHNMFFSVYVKQRIILT